MLITNYINLTNITITDREKLFLDKIHDLDVCYNMLMNYNNAGCFYTGTAAWGSNKPNDIDIVCFGPMNTLLIKSKIVNEDEFLIQSKYFNTSYKILGTRINLILLDKLQEYYQWKSATIF